MDIETVTQPFLFTKEEITNLVNDRNSKVRAVGNYPEGTTVLMPLDGGGCALMFLREEEEVAEFICAGNFGSWLKTYAEAWIVNTEVNYEPDGGPDVALNTEIFHAALEHGLSVCMGGHDKPLLMVMSEQERTIGSTTVHIEAFDISAINDVVGKQVVNLENMASPEADAKFSAALDRDFGFEPKQQDFGF
jgi:hypothetical protein